MSAGTRLLVIGASSFLGGHLLRSAAEVGLQVVTAGRTVLPGEHLRLDLAADGPARIAAVIGAAAPCAVINCAGATGGSPEVLAAANITAVHDLLTALLRFPAPRPRLVHIGSAAEYGGTEPGMSVSEASPCRPSSLYGATKLAGTRLVELARTAGLDAVALRVFNVVGAGAPRDGLPGAAAAQIRQVQDGEAGQVRLGPLDGVRDFIDAGDVADAVLAAATAPALPHPVLNIGSGTGVPARMLIKELVAVSGYGGIVEEDAPGSARSAALSFQQADIALARTDLGWSPTRDLTASVTGLWKAISFAGDNPRSPDRLRVAPASEWPRLVVPAYFHPDTRPRDWDWLAEHPKEVRLVVLNIASGPGTAPEPAFRRAVDRLHSAGVGVIGYADTDYGERRPVDVLADLGQYQDWYGVEGLCLDRVASGADKLPWYSALAARLRAAGARTLFFNHGIYPDPGYASVADLLGTFEGPWHAYRKIEVPRWAAAFPPEKFYHVVYSVPPGRFDDAVRLALRRRAAAVYVTWRYGDNPYDRLPVDDRK